MIKLCPHFQTLPKWTGKVKWPGEWVKVMDPGAGIQRRFPGKKIVGRWYMQDEGQYIRQGAAGGEAYFWLMRPKYDETAGDVFCLEAVNEPPCKIIEQVDQLTAFLQRWVMLCHDAGFRTAVPAFSVGNPETWPLSAMRYVYEATDYQTLHEYGQRRIDEAEAPFTSLRHRMLTEYMLGHNIRIPPLLITEAGIDRGGAGYRHKPGQTQWRAYMDQLLWYERELQKDAYVEAAFVFTSGATRSWTSFDVGEGEWNDLAKALR